jgi:hypothetical protein
MQLAISELPKPRNHTTAGSQRRHVGRGLVRLNCMFLGTESTNQSEMMYCSTYELRIPLMSVGVDLAMKDLRAV